MNLAIDTCSILDPNSSHTKKKYLNTLVSRFIAEYKACSLEDVIAKFNLLDISLQNKLSKDSLLLDFISTKLNGKIETFSPNLIAKVYEELPVVLKDQLSKHQKFIKDLTNKLLHLSGRASCEPIKVFSMYQELPMSLKVILAGNDDLIKFIGNGSDVLEPNLESKLDKASLIAKCFQFYQNCPVDFQNKIVNSPNFIKLLLHSQSDFLNFFKGIQLSQYDTTLSDSLREKLKEQLEFLSFVESNLSKSQIQNFINDLNKEDIEVIIKKCCNFPTAIQTTLASNSDFTDFIMDKIKQKSSADAIKSFNNLPSFLQEKLAENISLMDFMLKQFISTITEPTLTFSGFCDSFYRNLTLKLQFAFSSKIEFGEFVMNKFMDMYKSSSFDKLCDVINGPCSRGSLWPLLCSIRDYSENSENSDYAHYKELQHKMVEFIDDRFLCIYPLGSFPPFRNFFDNKHSSFIFPMLEKGENFKNAVVHSIMRANKDATLESVLISLKDYIPTAYNADYWETKLLSDEVLKSFLTEKFDPDQLLNLQTLIRNLFSDSMQRKLFSFFRSVQTREIAKKQ